MAIYRVLKTENRPVILVKKGLLLALFLVASGCMSPSPYAQKSGFFSKVGYEVKTLAPGHYMIVVDENTNSSVELAQVHFHRRASELCDGKPYKHTITTKIEDRDPVYLLSQAVVTISNKSPSVSGEVKCEQ